MYRVFNMGLGFIVACRPEGAPVVRALVPEALRVGEIVPLEPDEAGSATRVILHRLGEAR